MEVDFSDEPELLVEETPGEEEQGERGSDSGVSGRSKGDVTYSDAEIPSSWLLTLSWGSIAVGDEDVGRGLVAVGQVESCGGIAGGRVKSRPTISRQPT